METKIISIDISPESTESSTENAGVMWEHNATQLVFNIDRAYIGNYKYYLEYRSLMGTKVRTEYLELNTEDNTVTYKIPVTMSSLKGVECYFNIIYVDEDGNTIQVIKPHKFCLQFDYSPDTDNSLAKVNDFSINALLEAIRLGTFKGEKGDTGDTGEKGDKGEKGDTGEVSLEYANTSFADAIKKSANGNPIVIDDASPLKHTLNIKTDANQTVHVRGKNLIPFNNKKYNDKYEAGKTYEVNGVSFTVNDDGSVTAKGTAISSALFNLYSCSSFGTGVHTVALSGSPEGASLTTYCLRLEKENNIGAYGCEDYGNGKIVENVDLESCSIQIVVFNGQTVDATFYPMLEFGSVVTSFTSPVESHIAISDEKGVVEGVESVASCMSIFGDANIECTYNLNTEKAIEKSKEEVLQTVESVKDDIEKLGYRLIISTTLEEDTQAIYCDCDMHGNPFESLNLKKVFLLFTGSFVNTTQNQSVYVSFNGGKVYQMYKTFNIIGDQHYGFWFESEKIMTLDDRAVYKSVYPSTLLGNFDADTDMAQGLAANNVALLSDLSVSTNTIIKNARFGFPNYNNFMKSGSKVYLFGI